jgi:orotate phosphoribosyltransferase
MQDYQREFIEFMVASGVLTFGDFVTKSGRRTPFFINTGNYRTGEQARRLGEYYAQAMVSRFGTGFDVLFGPAYKGIPLAVGAAIALAARHGRDVAYCFNRKEMKDHGEGGALIGHRLRDGDRVLIVEDVITAGTSVRETVPLLQAAAKVQLAGLLVGVDRMERGTGERSALQEVQEAYGMPACAIVTLADVVEHLHNRPLNGRVILDDALKARIDAYRAQYGA